MGFFKPVWESKNHEKMIVYALKLCNKGDYAEVTKHIRCGEVQHTVNDFNHRDVFDLVQRMTNGKQIADFLLAGGSVVETAKDSRSYDTQKQMHSFREQ